MGIIITMGAALIVLVTYIEYVTSALDEELRLLRANRGRRYGG